MIKNYSEIRQKLINRIKSLEFAINLITGLTRKEREILQSGFPKDFTLHDFILLTAEDFLKWIEKED